MKIWRIEWDMIEWISSYSILHHHFLQIQTYPLLHFIQFHFISSHFTNPNISLISSTIFKWRNKIYLLNECTHLKNYHPKIYLWYSNILFKKWQIISILKRWDYFLDFFTKLPFIFNLSPKILYFSYLFVNYQWTFF